MAHLLFILVSLMTSLIRLGNTSHFPAKPNEVCHVVPGCVQFSQVKKGPFHITYSVVSSKLPWKCLNMGLANLHSFTILMGVSLTYSLSILKYPYEWKPPHHPTCLFLLSMTLSEHNLSPVSSHQVASPWSKLHSLRTSPAGIERNVFL